MGGERGKGASWLVAVDVWATRGLVDWTVGRHARLGGAVLGGIDARRPTGAMAHMPTSGMPGGHKY